MDRSELLRRVKSALQDAFGPRLRGVILYGSEVRGTAEPDSDIDLLVLLDGPVDYWPESHKIVRTLYPLVLEWGRPIDAKPVDIKEYEAQEWPLYRAARQEGVFA
jgi:predicted nucleotidyltransferase